MNQYQTTIHKINKSQIDRKINSIMIDPFDYLHMRNSALTLTSKKVLELPKFIDLVNKDIADIIYDYFLNLCDEYKIDKLSIIANKNNIIFSIATIINNKIEYNKNVKHEQDNEKFKMKNLDKSSLSLNKLLGEELSKDKTFCNNDFNSDKKEKKHILNKKIKNKENKSINYFTESNDNKSDHSEEPDNKSIQSIEISESIHSDIYDNSENTEILNDTAIDNKLEMNDKSILENKSNNNNVYKEIENKSDNNINEEIENKSDNNNVHKEIENKSDNNINEEIENKSNNNVHKEIENKSYDNLENTEIDNTSEKNDKQNLKNKSENKKIYSFSKNV